MNLETYILEFSKYVISILMILYVLHGFEAFLIKNEKLKTGILLRQNIIMIAFHFSCFMVICFETQKISFLIFFVLQQVVLFAFVMLFKTLYPKAQTLLLNNMCMLLSISFVILTRLEYLKAIKQFIIASFSLVLSLFIPFLIKNIEGLRKLKWIYAITGVSLLGIVMILGQSTYGSKLSYSIAGISFQPSEFVKIIFVFFVAASLYNSKSILEIFTSVTIAALHVIIQVINKDLGSALIFFVVYIVMLYIATGKFYYLLLGAFSGSIAAYIAYKAFRHVQVRVMAWKDPWSVIDNEGYQITQSLFGVTSGGFWGLGLYQGSPKSIPFVEDDFIFSAIAEEFGIIFAICLIVLCVSCFIILIQISLKVKDKFFKLVSLGFGISYIFQIFLTIGGGTKFIPLTGVTLPLVSYGGSSVLATIILFAIAEGIFIFSENETGADISDSNSEEVKLLTSKHTKKKKKYVVVDDIYEETYENCKEDDNQKGLN